MDFITGNKFKLFCHYSYDESGFVKHSEPINETLRIFVKIDYVHSFFRTKQILPYILYTHNGDLPVDNSYLQYMDDTNLVRWYGQNIMTHHPKLSSIPIGLANEIWPHGNEDIFNHVMCKNINKERLIYANFDIYTNFNERKYCLSELSKNGLQMNDKLPFEKYLEEVAKSYFVISPNGNGIDCHKTWESLYLKSIPIVTKSVNIEFYKELPIIIIDNWSEFDSKIISYELYEKIWGDFDINRLSLNYFLFK